MVGPYGWVVFLNSHLFVILVERRHVCQNTENIDMSVFIFGILNIDVGISIGIFKYRDIGIPTHD